jgi:hypothetical protein
VEHRLRVFESRVLRIIFWPKRHEVTGEWRRLNNEELYDLYSTSNLIQIMKRWAGVCSLCGKTGEVQSLVGAPEGKKYLENIGVDGEIILKWIFQKLIGGEGDGQD